MPHRRLNKAIAGYHILMLLSAVDNQFNVHEDIVIREYMFQEFPFTVNLDNEMEVISGLKPSEWKAHFTQCVDDFYEDSTQDERNRFLKFAMMLTKADEVITTTENEFLQILFDAWDYHRE